MRFITMRRQALTGAALSIICAGLAQAASPAQEASSPAGTPASANEAAPDTASQAPDRAYQAWTTPEGLHMLYVSPEVSPHLKVQRCDDGALTAAETPSADCRACQP